jgi:cytosine/adenosine deaminase-related metal-dependent hydrolase
MATSGGARCLGREREIGSLEDGKLADIALWRVDGLAGEGIDDPVCTLVFGTPALERLFVSGEPLVDDGHLTRVDEAVLAREAAQAAAAIRAGIERWT